MRAVRYKEAVCTSAMPGGTTSDSGVDAAAGDDGDGDGDDGIIGVRPLMAFCIVAVLFFCGFASSVQGDAVVSSEDMNVALKKWTEILKLE